MLAKAEPYSLQRPVKGVSRGVQILEGDLRTQRAGQRGLDGSR
jgi:hypothetical protein